MRLENLIPNQCPLELPHPPVPDGGLDGASLIVTVEVPGLI